MSIRLLLALCASFLAPLAASAQTAANVHRIGFLAVGNPSTAASPNRNYDAFVGGMRALGYVEGRNLVIEWRYARGSYERLPELAADLVKANVAVIVTHSTPGTLAARRATNSIPIVSAAMADPVASGLVASLGHPGGNVTGLTQAAEEINSKQIELLRNVVPRLSRVAVLANPVNPVHPVLLGNLQAAARRIGVRILPVDANTPSEIERGFALMRKERADAAIVLIDTIFVRQGRQIAALAVKQRLPLMSTEREEVVAGSLMGYGASYAASYERAATFVDKIIKGAKPADLPVERPTKYDFLINRTTAKALGLAVPREVLLLADEVIE